MEHWFVANLKKEVSDHVRLAKEHRDVANGRPPSRRALCVLYASEGVESLIEAAEEHEAKVRQYENWISLVEDMVRSGLGEEAVRFYAAKRFEMQLSSIVTENKWAWTTDGIAHDLERRMNVSEQGPELKKVYDTLCAMLLPRLQPEFVDYYEQKRRDRPDLKLPAPEYWED